MCQCDAAESALQLFRNKITRKKRSTNRFGNHLSTAFNNRDDDAFSAVHSKEVIRVSQDDNRIFGYNEYFKKIPESEKARWKDWKRNIELRFLQRIASNDKAFEVGYYKSSTTNTVTGEKRTGYGKFYVLLRKENGTWKYLWMQMPMKKRMRPYL
jgi:ketosteroid isomerase-like protein